MNFRCNRYSGLGCYDPYFNNYWGNPYLYGNYPYPLSPLPYVLPTDSIPYYLQTYPYGLGYTPITPLQLAYSTRY